MESNNMKMWLFRSNLRSLESYHSIKDIETFKEECHDFYILQLIWFLENDYIDEAIVWRLRPKDEHKTIKNIHWKVNDKWFSQVWVDDFSEAIEQNTLSTDISLFRGGFPEYDKLTHHRNKRKLGIRLYLGAGQRVYPKYGGQYDKFLFEEEVTFGKNTVPFYKTASPNIFHSIPSAEDPLYDICYISNFSQLSYKGQEKFIQQVGNSKYLQSLRIVHIGNKPEIGISLCLQYNVDNIIFKGWVDRNESNRIINLCKFGLVYSNKTDGCPRVISEILTTGTPLFISDQTRALNYYRCPGVTSFNDADFERTVNVCMNAYSGIKEQMMKSKRRFTMDLICRRNWEQWNK
jgi:hypothetical protein